MHAIWQKIDEDVLYKTGGDCTNCEKTIAGGEGYVLSGKAYCCHDCVDQDASHLGEINYS